MEFNHPIRVGDKIEASVTFDGFDGPTADSNFGGRCIKDYLRQEYHNQNGDLVSTFICSRMRFERGEMQKRAETRKLEVPHPWKEEEIAAIEAQILAERPRGAVPRYWEDVQVGDEIDVITKGPLGLTDFIAFIAAGAAPIPRVSAHGVALKRYHKHPKWAFRDPRTHALEPVYSVHYNDYAAQLQGAQIAYDVGIQRTCWGIHSLTNWMGDAGKLKSLTGQYRAHVYLGDVVRLGGRVVSKEVNAQGEHQVSLLTWAHNQREQNVMPGTAVIALPSRRASQQGG
jgi:acyl dehydratase